MLQTGVWVRRCLFRSGYGLSVRMRSSGRDQKSVLANRVAVVTGSTDGICFAIARRLAQDGAHVVISSRKQQNVDRAVAALQGEGLSMTGTVCHLGKVEHREQLVATALEHSGVVDFLVCNAAVNLPVGSTLGTSEEVWDKEGCCHPGLLYFSLYTTCGAGCLQCKTALLGLTRMLALELAPKGIRVNCLVSGLIKTDFSKVLHKNEAFWNNFKENHQLQRIGQPEDCAGLVSFLCSPDASYITSENIVVAGFSPRL